MTDAVVGLFAKHPEPGRVKTRLGEDVGMERAAQFYAESLAWMILRLDRSEFPFHLFFAPADREEKLEELYGGLEEVPLWAQRGNDLGERMLNAVRCLSDRSSGPVLIVGSDSPDLPMEYLRRAREALAEHDVVFGPAEDGGYYLVGMNEPQPALFEGMEWSHPDVLEESLQRARRASLETETLPVWTDYDRVEDFRDVLN
jgi:rSAM/selenodomain-associated transferase 1